MPLTAEELEALRDSPQAASGDTGSRTARSADDVLKLDDRAAAVDALDGQGVGGGPKSGWRFLRPARVDLPGAR